MSKRQSSHFLKLQKKWTQRHQKLQKELWRKHKHSLEWLRDNSKQLITTSAASLLLLAHPVNSSTLAQNLLPAPTPVEERVAHTKEGLVRELQSILPQTVEPLTETQERGVASIMGRFFQIPVTARLQGYKLNRSYGVIGAEQHLMRYPGDDMNSHFATDDNYKIFGSGMAPGRAAWGYFANSKNDMTEDARLKEKYYLAVQTFLAPGWEKNSRELSRFFKHRKMLVVNPENGKAVVAVIGDAGPAPWTGKHLGGSPEVMDYLERQDGGAKGPVLYFFIDDQAMDVPLGPVYN